ncbi:MAG: phosphodiester glycosidase family protein [Armatimonadota bacterium]
MHRTRYLIGVLAVFLIGVPLHVWAKDKPESVSYVTHRLYNVMVHIIVVDLNDPTILVTPRIARNTPGRRQSFVSFMAEHQPLAQITGSYFSMTGPAYPIGDIVIGGKLRYDGPIGSALAIKPNNLAGIVNVPRYRKYNWKGYESVLQGGIRLVQNGKYALYPSTQGFRDPDLFRQATRTAVGIQQNNRLLLVAVGRGVSLVTMVKIMKALGCRDAMTLDGGTSTGLAFSTSPIYTPGRMISNVLMVTRRPPPPPQSEIRPTQPAQPEIGPYPPKPSISPKTESKAPGIGASMERAAGFNLTPMAFKELSWHRLPASLVNHPRFRYSSVGVMLAATRWSFTDPPAPAAQGIVPRRDLVALHMTLARWQD